MTDGPFTYVTKARADAPAATHVLHASVLPRHLDVIAAVVVDLPGTSTATGELYGGDSGSQFCEHAEPGEDVAVHLYLALPDDPTVVASHAARWIAWLNAWSTGQTATHLSGLVWSEDVTGLG